MLAFKEVLNENFSAKSVFIKMQNGKIYFLWCSFLLWSNIPHIPPQIVRTRSEDIFFSSDKSCIWNAFRPRRTYFWYKQIQLTVFFKGNFWVIAESKASVMTLVPTFPLFFFLQITRLITRVVCNLSPTEG